MPKNIKGKTSVPANPGKVSINKKSGGKKGGGRASGGRGVKKTAAPKGCRGKNNYILHNDTHKGSKPKPKGVGPNGNDLESHHSLQQAWAKENIPNYNEKLAPTITVESGKGTPHTIMSQRQNDRRDKRLAEGKGKWSSTVDEELKYLAEDMKAACFKKNQIRKTLDQQYKMLDKLKVKYKKVKI